MQGQPLAALSAISVLALLTGKVYKPVSYYPLQKRCCCLH